MVQKVLKQKPNPDVVLAVALEIGAKNEYLGNTLIPNLLQLGIHSGTPVIPSVIQVENTLEFNALLPSYVSTWLKSIESLLNPIKAVHVTEAMVPPKPDKPTVDLSSDSLTVNDLLSDFRQSLKDHGADGIFGIARKFKIIDDDRSNSVDVSEFTKCISEHARHWNAKQIKMLFDSFDKDHSGTISYDEFLRGLRGELNDRRKQLVLTAFQILDTDKSGVVELNDILDKYDGSKHPDVITGKRTNNEILSEFLDTFDGNHDGKITVDEFIEYYGNVSSSIDLDDYFELMIRNAWHISGGVGWCANSSCRRVLVVHKDGKQTVEEVKNDFGIKADDEKAIRANLEAQGINNIASISLTGNVSEAPSAPTVAPPVTLAQRAAGQRPLATNALQRAGTGAPAPPSPTRQGPGGRTSIVLG